MDAYPTGYIMLLCAVSLVSSIIGAVSALIAYSLLLRRISRWPDTIALLVQTAPTILEGLSRLGVGVTEITNLIVRAGGLNRITNSPRKVTK